MPSAKSGGFLGLSFGSKPLPCDPEISISINGIPREGRRITNQQIELDECTKDTRCELIYENETPFCAKTTGIVTNTLKNMTGFTFVKGGKKAKVHSKKQRKSSK